MLGEIVVVRTFGGRPAIRRVWEVKGDVVMITTEEGHKTKNSSLVIGFPIRDVFKADDRMLQAVKNSREESIMDWGGFKPWQDSN